MNGCCHAQAVLQLVDREIWKVLNKVHKKSTQQISFDLVT